MSEHFTNTDSYTLDLDYVNGLITMLLNKPSGYFKMNGVRVAFFRREKEVPESIDLIFPHRIVNITRDELIDHKKQAFSRIMETCIMTYRALRHSGLSFTSDLT